MGIPRFGGVLRASRSVLTLHPACMASEKIGYNVFPVFPITGPVTSVAFSVDTATNGANIILTGASYSARVQVSSAISRSGPAHMFVPPDTSFDTSVTLTPASPPTQIPGPFRFIRIVLDSGTLTGANIEELHSGVQGITVAMATAAGQAAGAAAANPAAALAAVSNAAIANLIWADLATKTQSSGPQFADGNRWVFSLTGTPDGGTFFGTCVACVGGFLKRQYPGSTVYGSWFGMVADYNWTTNLGTNNTPMLRAMMACGASTFMVESALFGYFLDVSALKEISMPVGTTLRGTTSVRNTRRHAQFPFTKFVIKQNTHSIFIASTNSMAKDLMFVYPIMDNQWTSVGQVTPLSPTAGPTTPPVGVNYPAAISAYRAIAGDSLEGFILDNVGIVGGTGLYDNNNATATGQLTFDNIFGYCFGPMFTLGRAYDTVRARNHQMSPNFLPTGTSVQFMSFMARDVAVWMKHVGKVDDFKASDSLIYGTTTGVDLRADATAANYCSGGSYTNVSFDGTRIAYLVGGRVPQFGMSIVGGYIAPFVGNSAGTAAVTVSGAAAANSVIDMTGVRVFGTFDSALAAVSSNGSKNHIQTINGATNVTFNIAGGGFAEYIDPDTNNNGLGGFFFASADALSGLRINLANVFRKDGKSITTALDGLFMSNGGNSAAGNLQGFVNRMAFVPLTAVNAAGANPTAAEFNSAVAELNALRTALIASGLMVPS